MPFAIIAFPGEVIAMLLTPIWIVLAAWRSFRKRHLSLVEGICAIVLAGEVAITLFGNLREIHQVSELVPGTRWRFRYVVKFEDTAAALNAITGDSFPAVFATTRCIALLELAAGHLLKEIEKPGELSVGVIVDVKHTAATPVGAWVEAEATYRGPRASCTSSTSSPAIPAGK